MDANSTVQVIQSKNVSERTGPRVLIVRLSAIGDTIHGVPVLCALRRAMPDAFIGWVAEGRSADILTGHPDLDAQIKLPRRWLKSLRTVRDLKKTLRSLKFDTTIDLQCLTKSGIAGWLSGAPRRIGADSPHGRELSQWLNNELVHPSSLHVIEQYLQIAAPLGATIHPVEFRIPEHAAEAAFAAKTIASMNVVEDRYAILNPGAGWISKMWPADRYAQVAKHLANQHGVKSVAVWAGEAEHSLAKTIVAESEGATILAPPTSIPELAALTRRARLFIGSDTGPLHLAVAVGTKSISLHGTSKAERTGAYGAENRALQVFFDGSRNKKRRSADNRAMNAIDVEMVCDACDELLAPIAKSKAA